MNLLEIQLFGIGNDLVTSLLYGYAYTTRIGSIKQTNQLLLSTLRGMQVQLRLMSSHGPCVFRENRAAPALSTAPLKRRRLTHLFIALSLLLQEFCNVSVWFGQ